MINCLKKMEIIETSKSNATAATTTTIKEDQPNRNPQIVQVLIAFFISFCTVLFLINGLYNHYYYLTKEKGGVSPPISSPSVTYSNSRDPHPEVILQRGLEVSVLSLNMFKRYGEDIFFYHQQNNLTTNQKKSVIICMGLIKRAKEKLGSATLQLQNAIHHAANSEVESACRGFKKVDDLVTRAQADQISCFEQLGNDNYDDGENKRLKIFVSFMHDEFPIRIGRFCHSVAMDIVGRYC